MDAQPGSALTRAEALQPIFIVGTPKSGTTFLFSLFDSHPNVVTLLESGAYHFPSRRPAPPDRFLGEVRSFYARLMGEHIVHAGVTPDLVAQRIQERLSTAAPLPSVPKLLVDSLVDVALGQLGPERSAAVTHFIEKTPRHYDRIDEIFRDYPKARVIHVLRDPRDNYLALRRWMSDPAYRGYDFHPTQFIRDRLMASLESAYRNVRKYAGRYRVQFYEDLIHGGEKVVRSLASWIGIPWHEVLLVPSENGELWKGNSFSPDLINDLKPFDTRPIGRWKGELSPREVTVVESIIHAYRLDGKYPPAREGLGFWKLLAGLAGPFGDEWRREFSGGQKSRGYLRQAAERLFWNYGMRRLWILWRLSVRNAGADRRLEAGEPSGV